MIILNKPGRNPFIQVNGSNRRWDGESNRNRLKS